MYEVITGLPDGVIGVEAKGEISASDYTDVLDPLVASAREKGKIRLLLVTSDDLEGYTGGAAWQDAKMGVEHFTSFEKVAVVTDSDRLEKAVKTLGWLMPGEVKVFDDDEQDDAVKWLAKS